MKAHVIADADAFAKSKGKVAIPISTHEEPLQVCRSFASFDYQFRLVDPDVPAAKSTILLPRPNVVVEQNERKTVDVQTTNKTEKPDLYTELMKLDDLRKKGIITEEEFQAQKAKLLGSN